MKREQRSTRANEASRHALVVLVVDDEAVVREGTRKVLEAHGFRAETAADSASALAHPALEVVRLVLCDLVLEGESGVDLIARLRRRRPELPIVLITGYATGEQETLARDAGATAFLAKPFDENELVATVRAALQFDATAAEEKSP